MIVSVVDISLGFLSVFYIKKTLSWIPTRDSARVLTKRLGVFVGYLLIIGVIIVGVVNEKGNVECGYSTIDDMVIFLFGVDFVSKVNKVHRFRCIRGEFS